MLALHVTGIWEFCRGAVARGVGVFGLVGEEDPGRLPPATDGLDVPAARLGNGAAAGQPP